MLCTGSREQDGGILYTKYQYVCAGTYTHMKNAALESNTCQGMQHETFLAGFKKNPSHSSVRQYTEIVFDSVSAVESFCSSHHIYTMQSASGVVTETTACMGLQKRDVFEFNMPQGVSLEGKTTGAAVYT